MKCLCLKGFHLFFFIGINPKRYRNKRKAAMKLNFEWQWGPKKCKYSLLFSGFSLEMKAISFDESKSYYYYFSVEFLKVIHSFVVQLIFVITKRCREWERDPKEIPTDFIKSTVNFLNYCNFSVDFKMFSSFEIPQMLPSPVYSKYKKKSMGSIYSTVVSLWIFNFDAIKRKRNRNSHLHWLNWRFSDDDNVTFYFIVRSIWKMQNQR